MRYAVPRYHSLGQISGLNDLMRWLIVEDALKDQKGHHLEWVTTFHNGFRKLGDEVTVLADAAVEADIRESLSAVPILPPSIWHRMSDGSAQLVRYSRVFIHAWQTWRVMERYLRANPGFDAIFVPTMAVHHLLAWVWLVKRHMGRSSCRVLLFFIHGPLRFDANTRAIQPDGSPTQRLMVRLLQSLKPEVETGKVVLGVETKAMQKSMECMTGLTFQVFPQPVKCFQAPLALPTADRPLEMACFGAARGEKGSEILQDAVLAFRKRFPSNPTRFSIQWLDNFDVASKGMVGKSPTLMGDPRVEYITRYFRNGEYLEHLARTDALLLPYRLSSYAFRGSRVAIEAAVNGIPFVATEGSTLAEVLRDFGAGLTCEDGNPDSLAEAILVMQSRYPEFRQMAVSQRGRALEYYSVSNFRSLFLQGPVENN